NDTINFSVTGTILLASELPEVTDSQLAINGPAALGITVDGGNAVQVMQVASGAKLNLNNVTVANGVAGDGGAGGITNQGTVTIANSTFSGNGVTTTGLGLVGGILNNGTLSISKSTFSGNESPCFGCGVGAIRNEGNLTISNSTFSSNSSAGDTGDGGILNFGTLTVTNTAFSGNSGGGPAGAIENLGIATITGSTFFNNISGINGGFGAGGITNG